MMDDNLLKPELAHVDARKPMYSVRAGFLVAFLGGPLAVTLFCGLNSWRQDRLPQDLPFYALGALLAIGLVVTALLAPELLAFAGDDAAGTLRVANRALALLLFGLYYLVLKQNYRASELFGDEPPNPWGAGIACAAVAALIVVGILMIVGMGTGLDLAESLRQARGVR